MRPDASPEAGGSFSGPEFVRVFTDAVLYLSDTVYETLFPIRIQSLDFPFSRVTRLVYLAVTTPLQ
jgi:hypothetical protein